MRIFLLAIAVLFAAMTAPVATAAAQSSDEPVVLMTLADVEREKAEKAERDAEIVRKKAACDAEGKKICWGVPIGFKLDTETGTTLVPDESSIFTRARANRAADAPSRAAQVDIDADVGCRVEQSRRDRDYVSGEGPICRKIRLEREGAEDGAQDRASTASEPAATNRESNCRTLADGSFKCGWQNTTTRTCETRADGTETCTTSTSAGVTFGRDD